MTPKIGPDERVRKPYRERDRLLKTLGFPNYKAYLSSTHWRGIRRAHLKQFPDCIVCECPAEEVHHLNYTRATLLGEDPTKLASVCEGHHRECEFNYGRKVTPRQASNKLKRMIAAQR